MKAISSAMMLVIETATAACSVALLREDGSIIAERHEIVGRGHAERLVPMIEELIEGRRPASILVDCGPGSFTGIRVGLSAAHGLAIGWRIPLSGYSALALLAAGCSARPVTAALHGGHGEFFVQNFGGDPLAPLDELRSLRPEEAALAAVATAVVGSGSTALVAARGWGEAFEAVPRASEAGRLPPNLRSLPAKPIYGRAPDAKPIA